MGCGLFTLFFCTFRSRCGWISVVVGLFVCVVVGLWKMVTRCGMQLGDGFKGLIFCSWDGVGFVWP